MTGQSGELRNVLGMWELIVVNMYKVSQLPNVFKECAASDCDEELKEMHTFSTLGVTAKIKHTQSLNSC